MILKGCIFPLLCGSARSFSFAMAIPVKSNQYIKNLCITRLDLYCLSDSALDPSLSWPHWQAPQLDPTSGSMVPSQTKAWQGVGDAWHTCNWSKDSSSALLPLLAKIPSHNHDTKKTWIYRGNNVTQWKNLWTLKKKQKEHNGYMWKVFCYKSFHFPSTCKTCLESPLSIMPAHPLHDLYSTLTGANRFKNTTVNSQSCRIHHAEPEIFQHFSYHQLASWESELPADSKHQCNTS